MHRGWTKRWRKRWDKELHREFLAWIMLDYFIDFAAYEHTTREIHGAGIVELERGEWAFTERELSEVFGVDRQRIRTTIKFLSNPNIPKSNPMINPTTNPKFTKIKVINYDTYQDSENNLTQSLTQSLTQRVPKSNPKQDSTISKEYKNSIVPQPKQDKNGHIPYSEIMDLYNEILVPPLSVCKFMNPGRKQHLKARWNQFKDIQNLDWWRSYFECISEEDWMMGRKKLKGGDVWFANFDYVIREKCIIKIREERSSTE
jgi:hypothetical protein